MQRSWAGSTTLLLSAFLCGATAACGDAAKPAADAAPQDAGDAGDASDATDAGVDARDLRADAAGDAAESPDAAGSDAATDGAAPDASAEPDAGPFMAIAPCPTPASYVTSPRMVSTGANVYEPACLRVPAGASVQIEASAIHPVDQRAGGSAANPITNRLATSTIAFPTPGFYPFLCPEHVDQGMIGVIWVTP